jgi:single-stranded DNA-binding protein
MLNQVILETRVVKNDGLKYSSRGREYLNLLLVFDTPQKKDDGWDTKGNFIRATLWGNRAKTLADKLNPGHTFIVRGKLEQNQWENENKEKRSSFSLSIQEIHFTRFKKAKLKY